MESLGDVRASFREALADTRGYEPDSLARRPAFISSVERFRKNPRRDVRSLPKSLTKNRRQGVAEVSRRMLEGSTSAVEQTRLALDAIEGRQSELNAFAHLNQSQGGNYILERWQRHGRCKHQCVGSGL